MRRATHKDADLVVDVISKTFINNQGINWMLSSKKDLQKQIICLAKYAFNRSLPRKGVFISTNEKGVALCFRFNKYVFSLKEFYSKIRFIVGVIGCKRFISVYRLEKYKKRIRPESGNYLYFWFFAVLKDGQNAGYELRDGIFKLSIESKIPIYAETSVKRNKIIYERFGFETYHYYENKSLDLQYWFMKWDPYKNQKSLRD